MPALGDIAARPRTAALTQFESGYSLRTDRYRFTQWGEAGAEGAELYDHQQDPQEMKNLADDPRYAVQRSQLSDMLNARIAGSLEPPPGIVQNHFDINRKIAEATDD